jgi:hypothetical protein
MITVNIRNFWREAMKQSVEAQFLFPVCPTLATRGEWFRVYNSLSQTHPFASFD